MKVIELLNKIANGEEVPKKIKYRNKIFIYDKDILCYVVENYNEYDDLLMNLSNHKGTDLNYEVEVIEEDKKIEKIPNTYLDKEIYSKYWDIDTKILQEKINEIIDKINEEN